MNPYEQRQEERRERLEAAADRARRESEAASRRAHDAVAAIPFGQPILVGHHSERGHRAALKRHDAAMSRAIEADQRAADLARRAAGVGKAGVSSDDPEAVAKLEEKAAEMRAEVERWAALRKGLRGKTTAAELAAAFEALGVTDRERKQMLQHLQFSAQREPVPAWLTSNLRANLRRVEQRIQHLRRLADTPEAEPLAFEGGRIEESAELNRVLVYFDAIPPEATRSKLKSVGFKWAPSAGAWMRQRSAQALYSARWALGLEGVR